MGKFVQGTLYVQEEPYRNELDLQLPDGKKIFLFHQPPRNTSKEGEDDPIDVLLESAKFYELLVIVRVRHATYTPTIPPGTVLKLISKEAKGENCVFKYNEILQGKVIDPSWDTSILHYQAIATPNIYGRKYVLLETAIGYVVMSHKALQEELNMPIEQIATDGYLEWAPSRLDIVAIIDKQEENPSDVIGYSSF